jgi:hypothetical protein
MKDKMRYLFVLFLFCSLLAGCQQNDTRPTKTAAGDIQSWDQTISTTPRSVKDQPNAPEELDEVTKSPYPTQTPELKPTNAMEPISADKLPVYFEITITTVMDQSVGGNPSFTVGAPVFNFDPDNKTLMINRAIELNPDTELLLGIRNILKTPNQNYEQQEIYQYPTIPDPILQILEINSNTHSIKFDYNEETFSLGAGETITIKETRDTNPTTVVHVLSNYGQLLDLRWMSTDSSVR